MNPVIPDITIMVDYNQQTEEPATEVVEPAVQVANNQPQPQVQNQPRFNEEEDAGLAILLTAVLVMKKTIEESILKKTIKESVLLNHNLRDQLKK